MKNTAGIFAILMLIFVGLACSTDETEKANKLVDEANKFVTDGNAAIKDAETKGKEFDKMVADADGTRQEQEDINKFAKESLVPAYDKIKENFSKAGEKFDEASKLKLNEKFKEYLQLKASEFKKRGEYGESLKAIPKALADSNSKDDYLEAVKKNVEDSKKILKEAEDLGTKAAKVQEENPAIFKQN